jgi:two-component system, LytTR family, sensor kinase
MRHNRGVSSWRETWAFAAAAAAVIGFLFAAQWVLASGTAGPTVAWSYALAWVLPEWFLWAALSPLVFALAARFPFARSTWRVAVVVHGLAALALGVAHAAAFALVTWQLPWADIARLPLERLVSNLVAKKIVTNVLVYAGLVGLRHALAVYRRQRERELRASRLEAALANAHVHALRMQLHPHFLFNALHALSELIHRDPRAADRMVTRLGDMLRATLDSGGAEEVPLRQELELLERYLDIERVRFRDRLDVAVDVEPECLAAAVPNLILQPLVENAIRHGIGSRPGAHRVEIQAARRGDSLLVQVRDDGAGLPDGAEAATGIGLANSRARIEQLYGSRGTLELCNIDGGRGLRVSLAIPFRPVQERHAEHAEHAPDPRAHRG